MMTNVYVDAFNLYYGCIKGTQYKWLNLGNPLPNPLAQRHYRTYQVLHGSR